MFQDLGTLNMTVHKSLQYTTICPEFKNTDHHARVWRRNAPCILSNRNTGARHVSLPRCPSGDWGWGGKGKGGNDWGSWGGGNGWNGGWESNGGGKGGGAGMGKAGKGTGERSWGM